MPTAPTAPADRVRLTFAPTGASVAAARRFVRTTLTQWGASAVVDDAVLLASELVTNAIVHAGTEAEVSCTRLGSAVRIEVADKHPSRTLPTPMLASEESDSEGGRGLFLSAALASAWGVQYTRASKHVWFALDLPSDGSSTSARSVMRATDGYQHNGHGEGLAPPVPGYVDSVPRDDGDYAEPVVANIRLDTEGRVRIWGSGATQLFGWEAAAVEGQPLAELLDSGLSMPTFDTAELSRWHGEYRMRHSDGRVVPVVATHLRTLDTTGDPMTVVLAVHASRRCLLESPQPQPVKDTDDATRRWLDEWADLVGSDSSRIELDELVQRVVERARDLFSADAAFILLASDDGDDLEVRAATGLTPEVGQDGGASGMVPPPTAARRIDLTMLPGVHEDVAAAPEGAVWQSVLAGTGLHALLTVPLAIHGRLVGLLGVAARRAGTYENSDAARLQEVTDRIALVVESARLSELERLRRGTLSFIAEASDLLAGTLDARQTLALAAQLVVPRLARWCALHVDDDGGEPGQLLRHVWHENEEMHDRLLWLVEQAEPPQADAVGQPWPRLAETAVRLDELESDSKQPYAELTTGDLLVLPLRARGRTLGTLALCTPPGERFRREAKELGLDLSRRVALTLDNALLYAERERASALLQRSLLPPGIPEVPGVDLHVVYEAAGERNEAGGDFYDVFGIRQGLWGFAIGDVCGTGPEAAAVTGLARHSLRLLAREGQSVPAVLHRLNRAILDEGERARFLTLVYGEMEPQPDGSVSLAMTCAGHPPPLVLRRDGSVRSVAGSQPLLGVMTELDLYIDEAHLEPEETLVAFTDGVTERREGARMLGEDGLAEVLSGCVGLSAAAIAARVRRAVDAFSVTPRRDDMAILVLRAGTTPRV